jgi:uncharacterized protein (TIGR03382 family)
MLTATLALLVASARADLAPEDTGPANDTAAADTAAAAEDDSGCATTGTQAVAPLALALAAAGLLARKRAR